MSPAPRPFGRQAHGHIPAAGTAGEEEAVFAMTAPPVRRDNPLTRSPAGIAGLITLAVMVVVCFASLPWTTGMLGEPGSPPPFKNTQTQYGRLPPPWVPPDAFDIELEASAAASAYASSAALMEDPSTAPEEVPPVVAGVRGLAEKLRLTPEEVLASTDPQVQRELARFAPDYALGTDTLGRSLLVRLLLGGTISLSIGMAAAFISVLIGTLYGAIAGYVGGATDAALMRVVDILYGLPYILLVVLLAVASDAFVNELNTNARARENWINARIAEVYETVEGDGAADRSVLEAFAQRPPSAAPDPLAAITVRVLDGAAEEDAAGLPRTQADARAAYATDESGTIADVLSRLGPIAVAQPIERPIRTTILDLTTLVIAIGGVSWLTMARVIRGQVMSLRNQPFVEAARAVGTPVWLIFLRHLLPNLIGPIVVYATLTVPQAILQESFLSFLGIGVDAPVPSWGSLAADGLSEVNRHKSHWWLLVFPSVLLAVTLLALNFVGEGLREAFDPKRARR